MTSKGVKPSTALAARPKDWCAYHAALEGRRGVYFMLARGFVKIGYASDVYRRWYQIQGANPELVVVIAVVSPTGPGERELHERFVDARVHGEWFQATSALIDFAEEHAYPSSGANDSALWAAGDLRRAIEECTAIGRDVQRGLGHDVISVAEGLKDKYQPRLVTLWEGVRKARLRLRALDRQYRKEAAEAQSESVRKWLESTRGITRGPEAANGGL